MDIYTIDDASAGAVAQLMAAIKPDWWDYQGAASQLREETLLARLVGWYLGEGTRNTPKAGSSAPSFPGTSISPSRI